MRLQSVRPCILVFIAFSAIAVLPLVVGQPNSSYTRQSHTPILIDGDNQFTSSNGVSSGSGTEADPYVIQGWDIYVPTPPGTDWRLWDGIRVQNTTVHFVIRDVSISFQYSSECAGAAIVFQNVSNSRVEESRLPSLLEGPIPCPAGMIVSDSSNISVERNGFFTTFSDSLRTYWSKSVTVTGNGFLGPVKIYNTSEVLVHHNNFYVKANYMVDDIANGNLWDEGYPAGGNYWDHEVSTMVDNCHGPLQNICAGPDGISDSPLTVATLCITVCSGFPEDRYPLMQPYRFAPDIIPPRWSSSVLRADLHTGGITPWSVTLSWTPPFDTSGIVGYRVYQGSGCATPRASLPPNTTSYTVDWLSPGTSYLFHVEAGDAAGNWSCDGRAISFQTPTFWQAYWYAIIIGIFGVLGVLALDERIRENRLRKLGQFPPPRGEWPARRLWPPRMAVALFQIGVAIDSVLGGFLVISSVLGGKGALALGVGILVFGAVSTIGGRVIYFRPRIRVWGLLVLFMSSLVYSVVLLTLTPGDGLYWIAVTVPYFVAGGIMEVFRRSRARTPDSLVELPGSTQ